MFIFYFFAAILIFLGYKSLRGGIDYLKYFKQELSKPKSDFAPFVSIIAPCRGLDAGLQENLAALFRQDFPNYEVLFVVDGDADEAIPVIEKARKNFSRGDTKIQKFSKIVIAGKATNEGQKVHNLRQAVLEVSGESEIFVFVDSDARPGANWLVNLIAPLQDKTVGCATGYRWFMQKRGGFATHLRSVWNASIASQLGADTKKNFCWGGATAIRRSTFQKLEIREKWRGALSDDFAITRAMKEANQKIHFVPQALTASVEDCAFTELLEFTTRQMKITRIYAPHLWKASLLGSFIFAAVFWTGILLLFFISGWHFWLTLGFLLVIFALGAGKAWFRLKAVRLALKDYEKELKASRGWQITLWTITPILYFYNSFAALLSRRIFWRGIEYELKSPTKTVIINRDAK